MLSLFDEIKSRVELQPHNHVHPIPNIMGDMADNHYTSAALQNHEAFKVLCEIVEERLSKIESAIALHNNALENLINGVKKLEENLLEKGFLTKDEMVIK